MYEPIKTQKSNRKTVVIIVAAVAVFLLLVAGMIAGIIGAVFSALERYKDSEEYEIAYSYLVSSAAFEQLGADVDGVVFNSYHGTSKNGERSATLGFIVKGKSFEVVCHLENGRWIACRECTSFE